MKNFILFIAVLIVLLTGCGASHSEVEELQLQLKELEQGNSMLEQKAVELQTELDEQQAKLEEKQTELAEQIQKNEEQANLLSQSIRLRFPWVVWSHEFPKGIKGDGNQPCTLYLEMRGGEFDQTQSTWNSIWAGDFQFRTVFSTKHNNRYEPFLESEYGTPLPGEVISKPMYLSFPEKVDFHFEDYNADGLPDFVISQYGAMSAGDYCAVFTIRENGKVEILPVYGDRRSPSMFGTVDIADDDSESAFGFFYPHYHGVSPALKVLQNPPGFIVQYGTPRGLENVFMEEALQGLRDYEQEYYEQYGVPPFAAYTDFTVRDIYEWNESHFELVRQELDYK